MVDMWFESALFLVFLEFNLNGRPIRMVLDLLDVFAQ